mmetsp:Transcript_6906/g.13792  ORF Transcript_6906/g.13792 Transcript_6906/m.13792 type:complete len:122 (+) Transcript_6906:84-449(+)
MAISRYVAGKQWEYQFIFPLRSHSKLMKTAETMKKFHIAIWVLCISRHFVVDSVVFAKANKQACNFRTRLTFRRPAKDNVFSILAGHEKGSESVPLKIEFNHGIYYCRGIIFFRALVHDIN